MNRLKRERSLTAESFGRFLRWLSGDDEEAVSQYETIRRKLVRYFIHKGCTDPDELFDETVDIVVGKIDAGEEILNPLAYCHGVAKNVWRQSIRKSRTVSQSREFPSPEPEDWTEHEQELLCLERCMNQLTSEEREVVTRYHTSRGRERIAARQALAGGKSGANALRIKVCRIRKDLRLCVIDCLKRTPGAGSLEAEG
jgi:DNA-directed RNA polymerase specialized sigma24 family protein